MAGMGDPKSTCRLGQGPETCRYLVCGPDGWECGKDTSLQSMIDARCANGDFRAMGLPVAECEVGHV